jgi:folate-binding protein YgfZ
MGAAPGKPEYGRPLAQTRGPAMNDSAPALPPDAPAPHCTALTGRGVLRLAGIDRTPFLQGLVSNDVTLVTAEWSIYATLLSPQGKVLYDFFIVADPEPETGGALLLDVEAARRQNLLDRLGRYRLRAKVEFADLTPALEVLALTGGTAAAAAGLPETQGATAPFAGGIAFVDPRLAALGVRLLVPRGTATAAVEAAGARPGDADDYDRCRLELGVPDGSRDLAVEATLPLEDNLDVLNAISWTKGCYVGQEVTARTRYRGLVRRRLQPVRVHGPLPAPGTVVRQGEHEVGLIRSGSGTLALAMLRLDLADPAVVPLTTGPATLTPLEPGWAHP